MRLTTCCFSNVIILTNGYVSSVQDSYFLSAEECITAGHFQNQQSNACRLSPDGHFGSKFVTVVATGTQRPPYMRFAAAVLLSSVVIN